MALIDLDFSLKAIEEYKLCQCKSKYTTESECMAARHGMDLAKMVLHNVPTVEAKPVVRAHWEWVKFEDGRDYFELAKCSKCGAMSAREYPYCRECGAQMDEVVE